MHTETLAPHTQTVFSSLCTDPALKSFYLSGGTALALHLGHRESEDLDFFTPNKFDPQNLQQQLECSIKLTDISQDFGTLNCYADDVKLQFLYYPYRLISKAILWRGVAVSSIQDIACTKLITISARGSKKDFVDLYFILQVFTLTELFDMLAKKYTSLDYNTLHILKSLVFFDTAEEQPMPKMHRNISWSEVKKFLTVTIKNFEL